jgi:hypothetical protein
MRLRHVNRREVICCAVMMLGMAAWTTSAHAQIPLPGGNGCGATPANPCFVADITPNPADFFFLIMESLTTPALNLTYQPNTEFISSLDSDIFSGISTQNAAELLPVTEPLPCDSYTPMINDIAPALQSTYMGALEVAQGQEAELVGEDFSGIAANLTASASPPSLLAATQAVGQATLTTAQEIQLLRQSINTLIVVIATDKLHQLDANVRSKMPRDESGGC